MKNKKIKNLLVAVMFVTIASLVVIAGTYAKYTSAFTGTGTATVAKWSLKVNGSENATLANVALVDTTLNGKVVDGKVAPGTDGGFGVAIDATGSEVAVDYAVEISNIQNKPTNMKFYSDAGFTNEVQPDENGKLIVAGTINLADVGTPVNVPLYWNWAYETTNGDATDTTEGKAAAAMTFDVSVVGTQADPTQP